MSVQLVLRRPKKVHVGAEYYLLAPESTEFNSHIIKQLFTRETAKREDQWPVVVLHGNMTLFSPELKPCILKL